MTEQEYQELVDEIIFSSDKEDAIQELNSLYEKCKEDDRDKVFEAITAEARYQITGIWQGRYVTQDDDVFTNPWRITHVGQWCDYGSELVKIVGWQRKPSTWYQIEKPGIHGHHGGFTSNIKYTSLHNPIAGKTITKWIKEHKECK